MLQKYKETQSDHKRELVTCYMKPSALPVTFYVDMSALLPFCTHALCAALCFFIVAYLPL